MMLLSIYIYIYVLAGMCVGVCAYALKCVYMLTKKETALQVKNRDQRKSLRKNNWEKKYKGEYKINKRIHLNFKMKK